MGPLQSRWEDREISARENRPGRRLYVLTAAGEAAVVSAQKSRGRVPRRLSRMKSRLLRLAIGFIRG
jgi:hypothetical protein